MKVPLRGLAEIIVGDWPCCCSPVLCWHAGCLLRWRRKSGVHVPRWLVFLLGYGLFGGLGRAAGSVFCFVSRRVPVRVVVWGAIVGAAVAASILLL